MMLMMLMTTSIIIIFFCIIMIIIIVIVTVIVIIVFIMLTKTDSILTQGPEVCLRFYTCQVCDSAPQAFPENCFFSEATSCCGCYHPSASCLSNVRH